MSEQLSYDPRLNVFETYTYPITSNVTNLAQEIDLRPTKRARIGKTVGAPTGYEEDSWENVQAEIESLSVALHGVDNFLTNPPRGLPKRTPASRKDKSKHQFIDDTEKFPRDQKWVKITPPPKQEAVEAKEEVADTVNEPLPVGEALSLGKHKDRIAALIARKRRENEDNSFRHKLAKRQLEHHGLPDPSEKLSTAHEDLKRRMEASARGEYEEPEPIETVSIKAGDTDEIPAENRSFAASDESAVVEKAQVEEDVAEVEEVVSATTVQQEAQQAFSVISFPPTTTPPYQPHFQPTTPYTAAQFQSVAYSTTQPYTTVSPNMTGHYQTPLMQPFEVREAQYVPTLHWQWTNTAPVLSSTATPARRPLPERISQYQTSNPDPSSTAAINIFGPSSTHPRSSMIFNSDHNHYYPSTAGSRANLPQPPIVPSNVNTNMFSGHTRESVYYGASNPHTTANGPGGAFEERVGNMFRG